MTIQQLIPKDKFDTETADRLFGYSYYEIKPIVPDLLTWIQDMNWPVARPVSEYLQSISEHLAEDILGILRGTDDIWKYWTMHVFRAHALDSLPEWPRVRLGVVDRKNREKE